MEQVQVNCPLTQDPPFMQLLRIGRARYAVQRESNHVYTQLYS